MSPGILVKFLRSVIFNKSLLRKLQTVPPDQFFVLTYHRILPKSETGRRIEPGMYVTPTTLCAHIRFLKKYFNIVSVEQIEELAVKGNSTKEEKPCCVITFDDGWLDFYSHAWPVLQEEKVPAVVYLPTALIGSCKSFWTDRLARLLDKEGVEILTAQLAEMGWAIDFRGISLQNRLNSAIAVMKQCPYHKIEELLGICEMKIGLSQKITSRSFMNWEESRELFASGLISFGSHTVNHAILTTLPFQEVAAELKFSKQRLQDEGVVGKRVSFCYPNGNYTAGISELVAGSGYSSAMTCDFGWNKPGANLFSLKRISMHQDISFSDSLLAYRLAQF